MKQKNICIVSFCNLYILPYANMYINKIIEQGCECDILFWDRDASGGERDKYIGCKNIVYQAATKSKFSIICNYIKATLFFVRHIWRKKYDGLIFLQSHAAVACFLPVLRFYKKRYIVDVRDYSLENYWLFRLIEKRVIGDSYMTIISSPAYKNFLPKDAHYYISHNFNAYDPVIIKSFADKLKQRSEILSISFVGTVRFYDMDKKILDLFANDRRYKINYYGRGSEVLADYCKIKRIENVEFIGSFEQSRTTDLYKQTDIINNLYGNHDPFLDYALSNKLYHSAQLYIPIIVCPETYMAEITQKYGIGFVFDVDNKESKNNLYDWYTHIDIDAFRDGCDSFTREVIKENEESTFQISQYIKAL